MTDSGPHEWRIVLPAGSPAEKAADSVIADLKQAGFSAFRVGGCVRDRLLGKMPHEVDVATDAVPKAVREIFPASFAVGESFGVIVVHTATGEDVEVATFRADGEYADGRHPSSVHFSDLQTDAERRDFTINALFYDPSAEIIIDHVGGLDDLRRGLVRAIGCPGDRFVEDRLRMLRAVRFAAALRFRLDTGTRSAVAAQSRYIGVVSRERIFAELNRMLSGPAPAAAVEMLADVGLLAEILPEVEAMKGVEQPPQFHPEGDVWTHTLLMLKLMRWPSPALAWSVLLHDVGKPPCHTFDGYRHRFNGHAEVGSKMAKEILLRLKASRKLIDCVCANVGSHMTFLNVQDMRTSTFRRLISRPNFPLELELHRLDCLGSHRLMDHYCYILDRLAEFASEPAIPEPLVNGRDLIAMGMKPGPELGRILKMIQERQLEGLITTRKDALEWAGRMADRA